MNIAGVTTIHPTKIQTQSASGATQSSAATNAERLKSSQ